MIASIMVGISGWLLFTFGVEPLTIAIFITATAVTHCFFDFIPSLFLGIPTNETLSLLPGQELVRNGRGKEALLLSLQGSWYGLAASAGLLVIFMLSTEIASTNPVGQAESFLRPWLFWLMLIIAIILILTETRKLWAAVIFTCSGLFGLLLFATPLVPGGSDASFSVLFPALSGIFGVSGLVLSLFEKAGTLPKQQDEVTSLLSKREIYASSARGMVAGMAVGILPGLGGANATTMLLLLEQYLGKKKMKEQNGRSYIVTTSAINTSDTLFGIAALYLIHKSRSGASVAIEQLMGESFGVFAVILLTVTMIVAGWISLSLIRKSSLFLIRCISALEYKALSLSVIGFISCLVYLVNGVWGIIILVAGCFLGMTPQLVNVRRTQAMGVFLVPVLLFFSGYERVIISWLHMESKLVPEKMLTIQQIGIDLGVSVLLGILCYILYSTLKMMNKNRKTTFQS